MYLRRLNTGKKYHAVRKVEVMEMRPRYWTFKFMRGNKGGVKTFFGGGGYTTLRSTLTTLRALAKLFNYKFEYEIRRLDI